MAHDVAKTAKAADLVNSLDSKQCFSRKHKSKVISFFDETEKIMFIYRLLVLTFFKENNTD